MSRIDTGLDLTGGQSNRKTLLIAVGLLFAGFFVGQFAAGIPTALFIVINGHGVEVMNNPDLLYQSISKTQLLIAQSSYTLVFTFLFPWLFLKYYTKKDWRVLSHQWKTTSLPFALTILATVAFMFVNAYLIEWNASWDFPDWMGGLKQWMQEMEEELARVTAMFSTFDHVGQFILAFVVIAVLPGIGEELLFRGILQNTLHRYSKNAHLAIWVSAFVFGAIHMQFYGLVPRMMLGAIFGYLYVWSGNMWYPIIAHIVNNGVGLLLAYLFQLGVLDFNVDETSSVPVSTTLIAFAIFCGLMFLFRNQYLRPKSDL